jgi:hypothetical protein
MNKTWLIPTDFEDEEAESEFWAQFTGAERIEILEEMRREAWGPKYDEPMARVARVVRFDETEDS